MRKIGEVVMLGNLWVSFVVEQHGVEHEREYEQEGVHQ